MMMRDVVHLQDGLQLLSIITTTIYNKETAHRAVSTLFSKSFPECLDCFFKILGDNHIPVNLKPVLWK